MKENKLRELLNSLSLQEKVYQLVQLSGDFFNNNEVVTGPLQKVGIDQNVVDNTGSVFNIFGGAKAVIDLQKKYLEKSKNKIPMLFLGDVIYGYATSFPIPLAYGCTWNPLLIEKMAEVIAKEASAAGLHGTFAPMADLVRDPRWGRCLESNGEDPYLNSQYVAAMVRGFQGDFSDDHIASCVKHFAGYGAGIAGREYNGMESSMRNLYEVHFPPFQAAIKAGCEMVMPSFNTINGVPCTGNKHLLKNILREQWGFQGLIVTDYSAIQELIDHGFAEDKSEAAKLAMDATVDVDMRTNCYANELIPLIESGQLDEKQIDDAVWRILKLKNKLGLFENPYRGADVIKEKEVCACQKHRELAKDIAAESIVLLQNRNSILPLQKNLKISLIGPYADTNMINGFWAPFATKDVKTLKDCIEVKAGKENVYYAMGCPLLNDNSIYKGFGVPVEQLEESISIDEREHLIQEAEKTALKSDVILLALGEHHLESGEAASRTQPTIPPHQVELLQRLKQIGKPIVLVMFNGRPFVLNEELACDAIIEAWFPGTGGCEALTDLLYNDRNFSAKLSMSFPRAVGQIPVYYNELSTGRPAQTSTHNGRFLSKYIDCENTPLFEFGFGLSYTSFDYSSIHLSSHTLTPDTSITASICIKNTGKYDGVEVVQLYIHDIVASVTRPVKELKGFQRVFIKANETKEVQFEITEELLKFYNNDICFTSEKGDFDIYIGSSSMSYEKERFKLIK